MTYVYPYNNGLWLGTDVDVVVTNKNSEPVDAIKFLPKDESYIVTKAGGNSISAFRGRNKLIYKNGMIRLMSCCSYCRGYATDNVYYMLKQLVILLKKRAFLSFVSAMKPEDFDTPPQDGVGFTAGGYIKVMAIQGVYSQAITTALHDMTYNTNSDTHNNLKNNIRLLLGIPSLLLDRRSTAEFRRSAFGPNTPEEFRFATTDDDNQQLLYQTTSNFWLFSPALTHMMLGALRLAYFITYNKLEKIIWKDVKEEDVHKAILQSDYDAGKNIWDTVKSRMNITGYPLSDNPYFEHRNIVLDFLFVNGINVLGQSIYKNWQLQKRLVNYGAHFAQLPSWEVGVLAKVLTEKHPQWEAFSEFRNNHYAKK